MESCPCGVHISDSNTSYEVFKMCAADDPSCCGHSSGKIYRGDCKCARSQCLNNTPCAMPSCATPRCCTARLSNINPPRVPGDECENKATAVPCGVQIKYHDDGRTSERTKPPSFLCLLGQFHLYVPGLIALAAALCLVIFNMGQHLLL